jgi:hypothetical protein
LVESFSSGGLEAGLLQLFDDKRLGLAQLRTSGLAALHLVVGQNFDVFPPRLSVEVVRSRLLRHERSAQPGGEGKREKTGTDSS